MRVLTPRQLGPEPGLPTFRHSPWGDFVGFAVCLGILVGGGFAVWRAAPSIPGLLWVAAGPIALLGGGLMAIVTGTLWSAFRASLRPENWFVRLRHDGLLLNLRSYRNAQPGEDDDRTVVELPFQAIASMARVDERYTERGSDGPSTRRRSFLELRLRVDTDELDAAVRAERQRPAVSRRTLLGTSSTKHHHYPVTTVAAGRVRIEWRRALMEALREHVSLDPRETIDLNAELPEEDPERRALELARRGERLSALRVLREHRGLDLRQAKAWLDERGDAA